MRFRIPPGAGPPSQPPNAHSGVQATSGRECDSGAAGSWIGGLGTYEAWLGGLTGCVGGEEEG